MSRTGKTAKGSKETTNRDCGDRYRLFFDSNPLPVWVFDEESSRILEVNDAAVRLYGYSHDEFRTLSVREVRPPDEVPHFLRVLDETRSGEAVTGIQSRHIKKNGEIIEVDVSVHKFTFNGRPARLAVIQDVSERIRLAAAAATEQAEKLDILENINEAFVSFDLDWRYTFVNKAAERHLNMKAEELIGKRLWDVFPEVWGSRFHKEFEKALETGEDVFFDEYFAPSETWVEVHAFPRPYGIVVFYWDITERKRSEQMLREMNQLLEQTYDAIFTWDLDDGIITWNPNAERLYGYSAAEAVGVEVAELLKTIYPKPRAEFIADLRKHGFWEGELVQTTKSGEQVIVESRKHLIQRNGDRMMVLETARDITERRQMDAKLARASQLALVGELAAGLAHEIKNPLAGIKGVIDILLHRRAMGKSGADEAEVLVSVSHEIDRIDRTVRALLQHARPGVTDIRPAPLDDTVRRAVQLASHQSRSKDAGGPIRTEIEMDPDSLIVPHDAAGIEDVVLNLLLNARDAVAARKSARVTVRCGTTGKGAARRAFVEVADNGSGIEPDRLEKIFVPFETTKEKGTGLGLTSVKRIVRAHGGEVTVKSKPGKGSVFRIEIPAGE